MTGWANSLRVERLQNLPSKWFFDFSVARNRLDYSGLRIDPKRMRAALPLQVRPGMAQPLLQVAALH